MFRAYFLDDIDLSSQYLPSHKILKIRPKAQTICHQEQHPQILRLLDLKSYLTNKVNHNQLDLLPITQQLPRYFIVVGLAFFDEQIELVMHVAFEVAVAVVVLLVEGHAANLVGIVQGDELGSAVDYFNLLVLLLICLYFLVYVVSSRRVAKIEYTLCLFVLVVYLLVLFLGFQ